MHDTITVTAALEECDKVALMGGDMRTIQSIKSMIQARAWDDRDKPHRAHVDNDHA